MDREFFLKLKSTVIKPLADELIEIDRSSADCLDFNESKVDSIYDFYEVKRRNIRLILYI